MVIITKTNWNSKIEKLIIENLAKDKLIVKILLPRAEWIEAYQVLKDTNEEPAENVYTHDFGNPKKIGSSITIKFRKE